ncbi:MAG: cysteine desulfurase [Chloroflexi bacterium]|nr:cysteine desulfurase [Chloroflexota bacterium]
MLDVEKIREDFPVLSKKVYGDLPLIWLDSAATSQKPRSMIQSIVDYYEGYNANVHRGVHALSIESTAAFEDARQKVADFINAESSECIIWTRNTTESINLVANTWAQANIKAGDEILVTAMEHHSNLVPWQKVARDKDATLRIIPITEDHSLDLSEIDSLINPRTKLVAVVHKSNSIGTVIPVKELAAKARAVGAAVLVDGAQSVPHMPVDVADIDCDFLAFSGHKMLGPTGIGVLYVKPDVLERMEPFLRGGEMVLEVSYEDASWNSLPWRFEAGTPNIAGAIGLGVAVDYLNGLGMENVRDHDVQLTKYALDAFKELEEELEIFGPKDPAARAGIISFHHPDVHPHDLGTVLDRRGIAIRTGHHCTMPLIKSLGIPATARASFYLYNTNEEVDALVDAIKEALRYFGNGVGTSG